MRRRRGRACITQKKPLYSAALKWREEIESQGYSIARTTARQSHGMDPNFVPGNSQMVVVYSLNVKQILRVAMCHCQGISELWD